jgi:hypothetical protein
MEQIQTRNVGGRFVFGIVMILLGALFLAHNLDIIYVDHIGRYWPLVFVLIGLVKLSEAAVNAQRGTGLGWIFLGAWLFISMNRLWGFDFHNSWPILIIGWGVSLLWRALYRQPGLLTAEEQHHGN